MDLILEYYYWKKSPCSFANYFMFKVDPYCMVIYPSGNKKQQSTKAEHV